MANMGAAASGAASGAAAGAVFGPWGAAIGGVAGGLIGLFSGGDDDQLKKEAMALYDKFGPVDLSSPVVINQLKQAGVLSPAMEQSIALNQDKILKYKETHPEDKQNQEFAMNALKQMSQNGMSAQDLAQFNQMRSQVASDTNAKTQQLLQQAQMRGQLGSGDTLASQLLTTQADGQIASKQADALAAAAGAARQSALTNYANLANTVRTQDSAADTTNNQNELIRRQFLDSNSLARNQRNTAATNNADLYNVSRQQGVADANTKAANAELYRQVQAKRDYFNDQLNYSNAKAGAMFTAAGVDMKNNAQNAQSTQNMISGLGSMAGTVKGLSSSSGGGATTNGTAAKQTDALNNYNFDASNTQNASLSGYAHGGTVPGVAPVEGDSKKNDIVVAKLSPGEHILPRTKVEELKWIKGFIDHILGDETPQKKK
jgi:hypothetical protein